MNETPKPSVKPDINRESTMAVKGAAFSAEFNPSAESNAPVKRRMAKYGRGQGWSNHQWQAFDRRQRTVADEQEVWVRALRRAVEERRAGAISPSSRAAFNRMTRIFGIAEPTDAQVDFLIGTLTNNITALRGGNAEGYTADLLDGPELRRRLRRTRHSGESSDTLMWAEVGGGNVWVNGEHPLAEDGPPCSMRCGTSQTMQEETDSGTNPSTDNRLQSWTPASTPSLRSSGFERPASRTAQCRPYRRVRE